MRKKTIVIYLGSDCNLNCSYCHRERGAIEQPITKDFLMKLETFDGIIAFRGGEPTLYIDEIKKIVNIAKNADFQITTNGILLNKYIDFFKKYNFKVSLSYDGTNIRPYNPMTKYIDYPHITTTNILSNKTDFNQILDNFDTTSLLCGHRIGLSFHLGHHTSNENKELYMTKKEYNMLYEQIKSALICFYLDYKNYYMLNYRYKHLYDSLRSRMLCNFKFGETPCNNEYIKRVDSSGVRFTCSYIRDTKLNENSWLEQQQNILEKRNPSCKFCSVYNMCGGGCLKCISHKNECFFYYKIFTWFRENYIDVYSH
jgi:uncharacterized protein